MCFSCNNWLINWHSLQAMNSNDAESQNHSQSQSAAHMGNSCAGSSRVAQQSPKLRPVAQVRPQQQPQRQVATETRSIARISSSTATPTAQPAPLLSYNKRRFGRRSAAEGTRGVHKVLRHCGSCGAAMVLRLLTATPAQTLAKLARRSVRSQCRKCRSSELCKWRQLHRRSIAKVLQLQRALRQRQGQRQETTLVKTLATPPSTPTQPQYQRLQAPRVDGKVVAMFRRLGTTLSLETQQKEEGEEEMEPRPTARTVRIMSPAKQRPRWTRTLDDDEILLEFDSAISEVLPATPASTTARRRLRYQLTEAAEAKGKAENRKSAAVEVDLTHQTQSEMNLAGLQLPRGLSITLV